MKRWLILGVLVVGVTAGSLASACRTRFSNPAAEISVPKSTSKLSRFRLSARFVASLTALGRSSTGFTVTVTTGAESPSMMVTVADVAAWRYGALFVGQGAPPADDLQDGSGAQPSVPVVEESVQALADEPSAAMPEDEASSRRRYGVSSWECSISGW